MITQARLKELLNYNQDTGHFTWVKPPNWSIKIGSVAGYVRGDRYIGIKIDGKNYLSHRLIFLYINGRFPKNHTDHINHNRSDNRLSNLREATQAENNKNASLRIDNKSGASGVIYRDGKWHVNIRANGNQKHIGVYASKDDAVSARKEAESLHGYHINHGAGV